VELAPWASRSGDHLEGVVARRFVRRDLDVGGDATPTGAGDDLVDPGANGGAPWALISLTWGRHFWSLTGLVKKANTTSLGWLIMTVFSADDNTTRSLVGQVGDTTVSAFHRRAPAREPRPGLRSRATASDGCSRSRPRRSARERRTRQ